MFFWIIVFSVFLITFIVNFFIDDRKRKILLYFLFFFITVIGVFRNNIGLDYFEYEKLFYNTDLKLIEPSFFMLSFLLKSLGLSSQALFAVYVIFINYFIYLGAKYYFKDNYFRFNNFIIFWCLYFIGWWNSLTQIRQVLALSVIFYTSRYLIENNLTKYLIGIIGAFFIHYSSIALILVYPLKKLKINIKYFIPILIIIVIFSISGIIRDCIIFFINSLPFSVYKITAYVNNETKVLQSFVGEGGSGLGTLFYYLIFISSIILLDDKYNFKNNLILLIAIGLITKSAFFMFPPLARMSLYFEIFGFVLLANFNYQKLRSIFIVFLALGMYIVSLHYINHIPISPQKDFYHNTNKNIEYEFTVNFLEKKGLNK